MPDLSRPITGNQSTTALDSLGVGFGLPLAGVEAVGAVGTVVANFSLPLTGVVGTGSAGTIIRTFWLRGVTKNSAGDPIGNVTLKLFRTSDDVLVNSGVSDGAGDYLIQTADGAIEYYLVAYLDGVPDLAGTTVNVLVGV